MQNNLTIRIRTQKMHKTAVSDPHRRRSPRDANGLRHEADAVSAP